MGLRVCPLFSSYSLSPKQTQSGYRCFHSAFRPRGLWCLSLLAADWWHRLSSALSRLLGLYLCRFCHFACFYSLRGILRVHIKTGLEKSTQWTAAMWLEKWTIGNHLSARVTTVCSDRVERRSWSINFAFLIIGTMLLRDWKSPF